MSLFLLESHLSRAYTRLSLTRLYVCSIFNLIFEAIKSEVIIMDFLGF